MNRNLFTFSLILVLLGIGTNLYFIAFLGLLLMIPSLLATSRLPSRTVPPASPPRQPIRRVSPPIQPPPPRSPPPTAETMPSTSPPMPTPPAGTPLTYSPALFPAPLLMPTSQLGTFPEAVKQAPLQKQGERDELVEAGAILALLKLFLG